MPKKKKTWCRLERTVLGLSTGKFARGRKIKTNKPKTQSKRWRCPDCKKRFLIGTTLNYDGDVVFIAPPHKKSV